jgi:hypothetical protein
MLQGAQRVCPGPTCTPQSLQKLSGRGGSVDRSTPKEVKTRNQGRNDRLRAVPNHLISEPENRADPASLNQQLADHAAEGFRNMPEWSSRDADALHQIVETWIAAQTVELGEELQMSEEGRAEPGLGLPSIFGRYMF